MSITNLNNQHLNDEQVKAINDALTQLETTLKSLNINLTPEDRHRYGRVNSSTKSMILHILSQN